MTSSKIRACPKSRNEVIECISVYQAWILYYPWQIRARLRGQINQVGGQGGDRSLLQMETSSSQATLREVFSSFAHKISSTLLICQLLSYFFIVEDFRNGYPRLADMMAGVRSCSGGCS